MKAQAELFPTNEALIQRARNVLWQRRRLVWLIGGAGSGKSTLSRAVAAARSGISVYDMDEAYFGRFQFDPQRHPATTAWFSSENPLGWMLSLSWAEFDALYRAANAEMLERLAVDLRDRPDEPLIIDGGITHPSVLVEAVPAERIIYLERAEVERMKEWDTAENRAEMKGSVLALPGGEATWQQFLEYDRRMTETLGRESRQLGTRIVSWDGKTLPEALAKSLLSLIDAIESIPPAP